MNLSDIQSHITAKFPNKIIRIDDELFSEIGIPAFFDASLPDKALVIKQATISQPTNNKLNLQGSLSVFGFDFQSVLFQFLMTPTGDTRYQLTVRKTLAAQEHPLDSLATLAQYSGDAQLENHLPSELKGGEGLHLSDFEFKILPNEAPVVFVRVRVECSKSWTVMADVLEVEDVGLEWSIFAPFHAASREIQFKLFGGFAIENVPFVVEAEFPERHVVAKAADPDNDLIDLLSVGKHLGFDLGKIGIDDLHCMGLQINVNAVSGNFSVSASTAGNWTIIDGIALEFVTFSLNSRKNDFTGKRHQEIAVNALLHIGDAVIYLMANNATTDGSWQFGGGTNKGSRGLLVGDFVAAITKQFKLNTQTLPAFLNALEIDNVGVTFNTGSKDFTFDIETAFPIDHHVLDAIISVALTHNDGSYTRKLGGVILVDGLEFDLIFQQAQSADSIFLAAYENRAGQAENIRALAELITDDDDLLNAAAGMTFNLKDALLVIDKPPHTQGEVNSTKILFGVDIDGGLDMSNLPLVGKAFPAGSSVSVKLQPLLTNQDFPAKQLDGIRKLVPAGGYTLPPSADQRIDFNIQLAIGSETIALSLPISVDSVKSQPATTTTPAATAASDTTSSATGDIKWFPIQKQLGPLHFGRIGIQYQNQQLTFLLDASISLAGLTLSLDGLFMRSKINPLHPTFGLHGMGIDYKKEPLEIGASFLRQTLTDPQGNQYDSYDGTAIIRTADFALAALGSYAYYQGHPSLFIYAFVDAPLGGPSFFFVTGLAAGFGYNRRLVMPAIDQVNSFPLVAEAMAGVPGATDDLAAEIDKLHEVIPPAVGEYFLAVGIRFSSFEIIDSFVLLAVSFGPELEVDILGLSTLVLPTPTAGDAVEPLAEIQMALSASFNPMRGYLKVRAALTPVSFILSRDCHLTGGFAFYTWFKDNEQEQASAGDFALTLGGYHPKFKPPPHYPKVAPLGFNWQVSSALSVKGNFYFALVPSTVMAGGHLSATWHSGSLKAWFQVGADFIISWKPYFYDASMYLNMGVSYTYHFFGTHHISVDVGADLHIWGPEFSGNAHVHLWIVTFNVRFGSHSNSNKPALTWDEFRHAFLPDISKWKSVSVTKGLVKQLGSKDDPLFIINPKEFALETNSAIPITSSPNDELTKVNQHINIGSMKITDGIVSTHHITIRYGKDIATSTNVTQDFQFEPITKHVPGAIWGDKFKHHENEADADRLVRNACTGFTITGKPIIAADETQPVLTENLLNDNEKFEPDIELSQAPADLGDAWIATNTVDLEATAAVRRQLLQDLGVRSDYLPKNELVNQFILAAG